MAEPTEIVLEGTISPADQGRFIALPFDVPEHITRMDVSFTHSDRVGSEPWDTEGNALDLGIFDPRENTDATKGFRGWSCSVRSEFFIDADSATPGYVPGPIQPGTWHLQLGLFKIWKKGCQYKITISLTPELQNKPQAHFPTPLPLHIESARTPSPDGWYKGDLHCHTYHSDGDSDPVDVVKEAERLGLDFLAVTDHNTISHQIVLNTIHTPDMLIPGVEITTYSGHWNMWGDFDWIDFRIETAEKMDAMIREARRRGYLTSCNHPRPVGPEWAFEDVESFDCVEAWNSPWLLEHNEHCLNSWETKLKQGKRFPAVGGSDNHELKRAEESHLAQPATFIYCPGQLSPAHLLAAIRQGHVFITESPNGPQLQLNSGEYMMGDEVPRSTDNLLPVRLHIKGGTDMTLQLVGAEGVLFEQPIMTDDEDIQTTLMVAGTYYIYARLATVPPAEFNIHCMTNPLYL